MSFTVEIFAAAAAAEYSSWKIDDNINRNEPRLNKFLLLHSPASRRKVAKFPTISGGPVRTAALLKIIWLPPGPPSHPYFPVQLLEKKINFFNLSYVMNLPKRTNLFLSLLITTYHYLGGEPRAYT